MAKRYISASEHYTGVNENTKGMLNKLRNQFKGGYFVQLNLTDFINYFNLEMILNNEIYQKDFENWECENEDKFMEMDFEEVTEIINNLTENEKVQINNIMTNPNLNYTDKRKLLRILNIDYNIIDLVCVYDYDISQDIESETNQNAIYDRFHDLKYESYFEVYQYFVIPNNDADLWKKYTNYPIFYNYDLDMYLLGITHYGMSWKYFSTSYEVFQEI